MRRTIIKIIPAALGVATILGALAFACWAYITVHDLVSPPPERTHDYVADGSLVFSGSGDTILNY